MPRKFSNLTSAAAALSTFLLVSCSSQDGAMTSMAPKVVFKLKRVVDSPDGKSLHGYFTFVNQTSKPVKVPGFGGMPPKDGELRIHYGLYDVRTSDGWQPLDVGYDGGREYYTIEPNVEWTFLISLGAYWKESPPVTARVRIRHHSLDGEMIAEYTSEPFTLESVTPK